MTTTKEGILFDDTTFMQAHGKRPSGYGRWRFEIDGTEKVLQFDGTLASAKAQCRKKVKVMYGATRRGHPLFLDLIILP